MHDKEIIESECWSGEGELLILLPLELIVFTVQFSDCSLCVG